MNVFLAGTPVTLTVPLKDKSGNPLDVSAVAYRVVDQDGVEVVTSSPLAGFIASSPEALITVLAGSNALAAGALRELRSVELSCVVSDNTVVITQTYAVEVADPLQVGLNSFQTYLQAEFTSLSVPKIVGWDNASVSERIAALIDARSHICQLNFSQLNSNINFGQDSLNYVPEGTFPTNYAGNGNLFLFNGSLSLLSPEQFVKLPSRFKDALRLAQVAEADVILGGDPIEARRRDGLMLESVGESKQMFRPGKPLELPVSRRALSYLGQFVSFSRRIGRGH